MDEIIEKLKRVEQYTLLAAKNVLTMDDVVLLTGYSKSHLYKLTCENRIPFYKPEGKQIYFNRTEVEAWMLRNRQGTKEEAEQEAAKYIVRKGAKV